MFKLTDINKLSQNLGSKIIKKVSIVILSTIIKSI